MPRTLPPPREPAPGKTRRGEAAVRLAPNAPRAGPYWVTFSRRDLRPFGSLFFSTSSSDFPSFFFSGSALAGEALGGEEGEATGAGAEAATGAAAGEGWAGAGRAA